MTALHARDERTYDDTLRLLSEGSVNRHFDAFDDIDWDSPDYQIDVTDPRWILPEVDPLGRHPWYKALPQEQQIAIGLWRQANVAKVGLQFENVLIRGLMEYVMGLPNNTPEYRYCTHEATEETHHTQMFQEFVNRSGQDVPGARKLFRVVAPFLPLAARVVPEIFFVGVLAGEEPIDHIQKSILRSERDLHPLFERIMQIHVAEEARHISFAHEYLRENVPTLNPARKALLSVLFPVVMRVLADVIVIPTEELTTEMGVPKKVVKELYWNTPESEKMLRDFFGDVRMLAEDIGVMNPVSRVIWKAMRINGRPSRFRSEPHAA
jgi:hypothetical protein